VIGGRIELVPRRAELLVRVEEFSAGTVVVGAMRET
jgi:hypothetical protein